MRKNAHSTLELCSLCVFSLLSSGCTEAHGQRRPRRRDAGVDTSLPPTTHGRLEPSEIQSVLSPERDAIGRCYAAVLHQDPLAQGELELRLRVEGDGRVSQSTVRAEGSSLRRVGECIRRRLVVRVFPRPTGGAATVVLPFRFAPEG